jgi:uncharacterized SAM-binding protein YcdF (DUF218 family)
MDWLIVKSIGALLTPPGIILVLLLAAFAFTWRRPPVARALLGVAILILYALSTGVVSGYLLLALQPEPRDPRSDPGGQAIVVLGGGSSPQAPEYGGDTVNSATLVRLRYAATLYRQVKKPILVSSGAVPIHPVLEAHLMRDILQREFQVPVTWVEDASTNTLENARGSFRLLNMAGITRIYLVTHAWHMARARYAFESAGLAVIPAPTAYARPPAELSLFDFLPSSQALQHSSWFFHEVIGRGWYHLRIALGR